MSQEETRLHAFCLALAQRLWLASSVLGNLAEKPRPASRATVDALRRMLEEAWAERAEMQSEIACMKGTILALREREEARKEMEVMV